MKIECLFWNIKDVYNNGRFDFLNAYAQKTDVMILAEAYNSTVNNQINNFSLIQPLQTSGREWIKIFVKKSCLTNFQLNRVDELFNKRVCVARFTVNTKKDIFLIGIHLNSKTGIDEKTQLLLNNKATQEIHHFLQTNHTRAIIVGDFNHNPFEAILNSSITFNSLSNRELTRQLGYRTYLRKRKVLFYNPMWNFIGDHDFQNNQERFNGTYFFRDDRHKTIDQLHWNLLDQILISEPIIDSTNPQDIQIITEYNNGINTIQLADRNFYATTKSYLNPDYSDHLPIKFSIDTSKLN
ncbi:MAG: hypothetical protein PHD25_08905 [Bacteroidales bacterium]|nr:hypothetical protein [Bacteroidales bacterium]